MIYQEITKNMFIEAFKTLERENHFSVDGFFALYDFLDELEENYNLDVIELCCEYTEYENLSHFQQDYGTIEFQSIEDIENNTLVLRIDDNRFIVQVF